MDEGLNDLEIPLIAHFVGGPWDGTKLEIDKKQETGTKELEIVGGTPGKYVRGRRMYAHNPEHYWYTWVGEAPA